MKYTFTIEETGGGNGREKIVLESRAGESDRHIALKLLAYLLFRDETGGVPLRIEQGVGQRHKPDLVATAADTGRVLLWIDCGQIETKRLGRIAAQNARARVVVVKATAAEADAYALAAARFLPPAGRGGAVAFLGFDDGFVSMFCALLRGTNTVGLTHQGEGIDVLLNGELLVTGLHRREAASVPQSGHVPQRSRTGRVRGRHG